MHLTGNQGILIIENGAPITRYWPIPPKKDKPLQNEIIPFECVISNSATSLSKSYLNTCNYFKDKKADPLLMPMNLSIFSNILLNLLCLTKCDLPPAL